MKTINVINVNQALWYGLRLLRECGSPVESRYGSTLELPCPLTTVYNCPWERVLVNPERDANPFFHLFEALWILAGRQDVAFLTEFNKRMAEFSDDGVNFHAPYGYRLRHLQGVDQVEATIRHLTKSPQSRRAVMQIWDADKDCDAKSKDIPCNDLVIFYQRNGRLTMTVYNRSNDMLWGAYGANAVQFSILHEYICARTGLEMGEYYQVSNSFHVYTDGPGGELWERMCAAHDSEHFGVLSIDPYVVVQKTIRITAKDVSFFDMDLRMFFQRFDDGGIHQCMKGVYTSNFFLHLAIPLLNVWLEYKDGNRSDLWAFLESIRADDWKLAASQWVAKRLNTGQGTKIGMLTSDPRSQ